MLFYGTSKSDYIICFSNNKLIKSLKLQMRKSGFKNPYPTAIG